MTPKKTPAKKKTPARKTTPAPKETRNSSYYPPFVYGRPLKFQPDELLEEFVKYTQWCVDNPIVIKSRQSGTNDRGSWSSESVDEKPRLISIGGFLVFIGADDSWWTHLNDGVHGEEFFRVKAKIKNFCENYQKEMASSGVFKENIISRLLGLADKKALDAENGVTIVVNTKDEADKIKDIGNLGV